MGFCCYEGAGHGISRRNGNQYGKDPELLLRGKSLLDASSRLGKQNGSVQDVNVRMLTITAGSQDIIEGVRERGQWLRKGDPKTKAVIVNSARHA